MSFPASVGQKYQCVIKSTLDGQQIRTILWYQLSALTPPASTDDICISINTLLQAAGGVVAKYAAVVPGNMALDSLTVQCVAPTRIRVVEFAVGLVGGGQNCDAPATTQAVLRTGDAAGRSHQGVLHLPISTDPGDIVGGRLSGAQLALLQTFANQTVPNLVGLAPTYVANAIISNGPTVAQVTLVTRAFAQDTVRTMRRRVVGRGI